MSDELLPYYNRELAFIRTLGAQFADEHPKIAGRLRLSPDGSQDPHVERMVQAFAYLNARTRHKLEDDFPEITDAMLGVLYPHYLAPTPSMATVQFALDASQAELLAGYRVERGTLVEADLADGRKCRYRTCYPTTVWPIQVQSASLAGPPFVAPLSPRAARATSMLRLELATLSKAASFSQLGLDSLRFFLHGAQAQNVYGLYELIFHDALEVVLASSQHDTNPIFLPPSCLRPVGFDRDQGILPYTARSFIGYRLLTEFFAFPEKFLFFDLTGLTPHRLQRLGNKLEVFIFLNRTSSDLQRNVTRDMFRLGCTPMVNLFTHRADPFVLTQTQSEYRLVPDARRPAELEIHSVDRVLATSPDAEQMEFLPFFSSKHAARREQQETYWYAVRRPGTREEGSTQTEVGSELYLSLVDLGFSPWSKADWTLDVETTCTNRGLPAELPFGGGRPYLDLPDGMGPLAKPSCLTAPTKTRRPLLKQGAFWKIISHLTLNHLSLTDGEEGADALREILKLYDTTDSSDTQKLISGLVRVQSRRVVGRAGGMAGGFCRGIEVAIQFNEERFSGSGAYLFGCVLDQFLGLYCSLNSFTRLLATTQQREGQGDPWRWPPRAGERVLL